MRSHRLLLGCFALLHGCGGSVASVASVETVDAGGSDAGADVGAVNDASSVLDAKTSTSPCPAAVPAKDSECPLPGLVCEYGTDVNVACDTLAQCFAGTTAPSAWYVTPPEGSSCPTIAGLPQGCPPSLAAASAENNVICAPVDLLCGYPEGLCICGHVGPVQAGPFWVCGEPVAGCPTSRPRYGSSCSGAESGLTCDYGSCTSLPSAALMTCQNGYWQYEDPMCPPSAATSSP
jgi:hypothetical protein